MAGELAQTYAASARPHVRSATRAASNPATEQAVEKLQAAAAAFDNRRAVEQTAKSLKADARDELMRDQRIQERKRDR
jgi:hypothetical protein